MNRRENDINFHLQQTHDGISDLIPGEEPSVDSTLGRGQGCGLGLLWAGEG